MKTKLKLPEALAKNTEPIDQIEPISTELEQASNVLLDSVLQTQDHMPQYYDRCSMPKTRKSRMWRYVKSSIPTNAPPPT